MNRIPFHCICFLVMTCFFAVSCDLPTPRQVENATESKPVVGVIAGGSTSFWKAAEYGINQAAEKNDLKLLWQETSQPDDFDQQAAAIHNFAARRVQGMVIATQNELMIRDAIKRATDQGIYALFIDCPPLMSPENANSQMPVVATDQYHAGQLAAEELAGLVQEKGRIAVIRYSPMSFKTENRVEGFLAKIQSYPEIEVVGQDLYTGMDTRVARDKMTNFLRLYSKNGISQLDGIFISNESTACEILPLIEQEELGKKIHFVTFGSDSRLIAGLLNDLIDAIFVEQLARMGQMAIDTMAEMFRGETVPAFLDSGVHCVTMDNFFSPYTQALLHPEAENSLEILLNEFPDKNIERNHEEDE